MTTIELDERGEVDIDSIDDGLIEDIRKRYPAGEKPPVK